jgi:hypothetical protein
MSGQPIFIVGVERSGTTLLAAMIGAHSSISCGPETHFFPRLDEIDIKDICEKSKWPIYASRFISTMLHSHQITVSSKYKITEEEIFKYLQPREPSVANLLSCLTEHHMKSHGKIRWAEKTPGHLRYVNQIREYFPNSPILRILRDPRDVALSLINVPWGPDTFLDALMSWRYFDNLSKDFFLNDDLCYTLRFEDLVIKPERELKKICKFIGENFEVNMLNTSKSSASVNSRNVPWKQMSSQPPNKSRVFAWKNQLPNSEIQVSESILGDRMKAYGYPQNGTFPKLALIYPNLRLLARYPKECEMLASKGLRYWKKNDSERPTATVCIGNLYKNLWQGYAKYPRILRRVLALLFLLKAHISRNPIYWIQGNLSGELLVSKNRFLKRVLRHFNLVEQISASK